MSSSSNSADGRPVAGALLLAVALVAFALLAAGCVTDYDSDQPWNTVQPWEGVPGIPGLSQE
jgi:hypothetical protein